MRNIRLALTFCLGMVGNLLLAQDQITLMNGQVFSVQSVEQNGDMLLVGFPTGKGLRTREFFNQEVFSYQIQGAKTVLYQPDERGISVEDMQSSIAGLQSARKNFSPVASYIGGAVTGFAAGYGLGSVLGGIAVPPLLMLGSKVLPVADKKYADAAYPANPYYNKAVKKQVRRMRMSRVLISSAVGVAAGLLVSGAGD